MGLLIGCPIFWDKSHDTVFKQTYDLIFDSHLKDNQTLADLPEITIMEDINDMPSISDMNDLQHDNNRRGRKHNLRPTPNLNYSEKQRY